MKLKTLKIRIVNEGQHFRAQISTGEGHYLLYNHKFKDVVIEGFGKKNLTPGDPERKKRRKGCSI